MALFKRPDLEAQGFSKDQIDYIMTESNRSLAANYVLKSDAQAQVDAAKNAAKPEPVDPKTTPEYIELAKKNDMLQTIYGEDFAQVKPKFRETVFGMLDRSEKAKPIAEQMVGIKEKFEEYYFPDAEQPKNTPQYSQNPTRTATNPVSEEDKLVAELAKNW
ncbi:MAG: hypothetical protein IKE23_12820 [Exiguobacterium sp.]|nr:hypothetical protein [Exiguobacterium sp.]